MNAPLIALPLLVSAAVAPLVLVASWNLLWAPRLHRRTGWTSGPMVSVLVPARDEADNLRRLIPALLASRYRPIEVLVLDDGSRDATAAVVRDAARHDPRVTLVTGDDPPPGWTGKNWACHRLAHRAGGELLVFCDADVVPGPEAIGRTVAALDEADALTAFPRHERGGWIEEAVVPLAVQLPVVALLPLPLVRRTRARSLAAGNGQWFAWRRTAYSAIQGHWAVRSDVLEDVRLARRVKAAGLRLSAELAPRDLSVRMYRSPGDVWRGFSKNLYLLAGGHGLSFGVAAALFVLTMAAPVLLPLVPGAGAASMAPIVLLVTARLMAARALDTPVRSVLLHPVGVAIVAAIAAASRRSHRAGHVVWKGRTLTVKRTVKRSL